VVSYNKDWAACFSDVGDHNAAILGLNAQRAALQAGVTWRYSGRRRRLAALLP
jgi:hypothetical protein